jgi:hypothetical protein
MLTQAPPVQIELPDLPGELYAGERTPVSVVVHRPADCIGPSIVRQFTSFRSDAVVGSDLFRSYTEVHPGESYRVLLFVRAAQPGTISLNDLRVQVDNELYPLGDRILPVRPSLRQEVDVRCEPICTYEQGTRVQISLIRRGTSSIEDLRVRLEPAAAVREGKSQVHSTRLESAGHGTGRLELEAVVGPGHLRVCVAARVEGQSAEADWDFEVPAEIHRPAEQRYCFLEPRKLSDDYVTLHPREPEDAPAIAAVSGIYWVRGKEHYRVVIRPSHPKASDVQLRELPEVLHVNRSATRHSAGRWEFEVFLPSDNMWTTPDRLFYDVQTPEGPMSGEIHLAIRPPAWKHWRIAATLGVALTAQSLTMLLHALFGEEANWVEALKSLDPLRGVRFWYLGSIPAARVLFGAYDWLQARLRM